MLVVCVQYVTMDCMQVTGPDVYHKVYTSLMCIHFKVGVTYPVCRQPLMNIIKIAICRIVWIFWNVHRVSSYYIDNPMEMSMD